jgi:hypothetical protein
MNVYYSLHPAGLLVRQRKDHSQASLWLVSYLPSLYPYSASSISYRIIGKTRSLPFTTANSKRQARYLQDVQVLNVQKGADLSLQAIKTRPFTLFFAAHTCIIALDPVANKHTYFCFRSFANSIIAVLCAATDSPLWRRSPQILRERNLPNILRVMERP